MQDEGLQRSPLNGFIYSAPVLTSPRCESLEQYQTCTWFQLWKLGFSDAFADVMPCVCNITSGTCACIRQNRLSCRCYKTSIVCQSGTMT